LGPATIRVAAFNRPEHFETVILPSTSSRSPGEGKPGEFRAEQNMKVIKCYLSGSSLVCTSARPARKHFDQESGRMPVRGVPESSGSSRK
jgi:hypothetical protein